MRNKIKQKFCPDFPLNDGLDSWREHFFEILEEQKENKYLQSIFSNEDFTKFGLKKLAEKATIIQALISLIQIITQDKVKVTEKAKEVVNRKKNKEYIEKAKRFQDEFVIYSNAQKEFLELLQKDLKKITEK